MAGLEPVIFGLPDGTTHERPYDRSRLKLGAIVYVRHSEKKEDTEFSPEQSDSRTAYWVRWIAPSSWSVELVSRFELRPEFAEKIHTEVAEFLSRVEIDAAIARLVDSVRMERFYLTAEMGTNPISVIFTILDRLQVCRRLRQSPPFPRQMLPYLDDPLVSYLYLTCFDRLGQPSAYLSFNDWLISSDPKVKAERDTAVQEASTNMADLIELTHGIHRRYLSQYGVKASFFWFVREVLTPDMRQRLLDSIEQTISTYPPDIHSFRQVTNDDKEKYLFKRRNDYTHKANFKAPIGEWFGGGEGSPVQEFNATTWSTTRTHDWPDVLEKAVRTGLARYLMMSSRIETSTTP